jgi:hypothetical protein
MPGRVIGGIAGWLIGVLPIVVVDAAEYFGLYLPNPLLFGTIALFIGVILGGIVSGYIGGRSTGGSATAGGASGASMTGGIAAALYVISTIALLLLSESLGLMTSISGGQLFHVAAALLFFAALWLGIAMLTGFLTGRDPSPRESPPPYHRTSLPRYTETGSADRLSRPIATRQAGTNDYNRHDASSRSSGSPGDHRDSRPPSRPPYPDRESDPRLS